MKTILILLIALSFLFSQSTLNVYWLFTSDFYKDSEQITLEKINSVKSLNIGGKNLSSLTDIIDLYLSYKFISGEQIPAKFQKLVQQIHLIQFYNGTAQKIRQVGNVTVSHSPFGEGVRQIGSLVIQYDHENRIESIGNFTIKYNQLDSRIEQIGDIKIEYDVAYYRINRIGDIFIEYEVNSERIKRIGGKRIKYDPFIDQVEFIGKTRVLYDQSYESVRWATGSKPLDRSDDIEKLKSQLEQLKNENLSLKASEHEAQLDLSHAKTEIARLRKK